MKRKRTTPADTTPVRVVIVTLDNHLSGVVDRAAGALSRSLPGLQLSLHAAANWNADPQSLADCHRDIAEGDIILVTMMFMEDHIAAVLPALKARRDHCDAMICCMSATTLAMKARPASIWRRLG